MKQIQWQPDELTVFWANKIKLPDDLPIARQYQGHRMNSSTWQLWIEEKDFPTYCYFPNEEYLECTPTNIMRCFQDDCFLEGLALTVAWGGMARTRKSIHGQPVNVARAKIALETCKSLISQNGNVKGAWELLTQQLKWSPVITSKVLHFLTRSCEYKVNPPVPFDNAVVKYQISPWFFTNIAFQRQKQDPPRLKHGGIMKTRGKAIIAI